MSHSEPSASDTTAADLPTIDSIRQHFESRLAAAELVMLPFPHLLLTEVLPESVYAEVLRGNPFRKAPGKAFGDEPWAKRLRFETTYDKRFQFDLSPGRNELSDRLWGQLGAAFSDLNWLGPVLQRRFPDYFSLRFGDLSRIDGFWGRLNSDVFLQRLDPGYRLDAHTDVPARVATCIFSFASTDGYERCGTQLLIPKNPLWRCWGNLHHPLDDFEVAQVAPYKPNAALVFFKTRHAWHSVGTEAASAPDGRFGMQVQVSEAGNGTLIDLSEPELMRNRQLLPVGRMDRAYRVVRRFARSVRRR